MKSCLLLLILLTAAVKTTSSILPVDTDSNTTLPLPLDVAYRCASPTQHDPGRQIPSGLDCLNVLTFMLATTPYHDLPTEWSRNPASGQISLP